MRLSSFFLLLPLTAFACAQEKSDGTESSESAVTSAQHDARRARLARLANIDALARLYLGQELPREELVKLGPKTEQAVLDALVANKGFPARFEARLAEFNAIDGRAPKSVGTNPTTPLIDTFEGKKPEAERFAKWLVRSLAPLVADALITKLETNLPQMTYRELLDAIRAGAKEAVSAVSGHKVKS